MRKVFITVVWLLIFLNLYAFKLEKQKGYVYKRPVVLDSLQISEPDYKFIDIEIRFYHTSFNSKKPNSILIILDKNNQGQWFGRIYNYHEYNNLVFDYRNKFITAIRVSDNWTLIWKEIIDKKLLNIKTESELRIKRIKNLPLLIVGDGDYYMVEVLTQKVKRKICYSNPFEQYKNLEESNIECMDLKRFLDLVHLLNREFGNSSIAPDIKP
ncbi:hypothetical protein [Parabacteroides sp. FAFU027]|uniref:hypothetical protein n=1 Tax=Parabacteroides sp. FAFU027 TaxID=2922715 RepID=UPI001FAEB8BD|nr:hypothetical protein [Parabacteroides sp. FAFU027]